MGNRGAGGEDGSGKGPNARPRLPQRVLRRGGRRNPVVVPKTPELKPFCTNEGRYQIFIFA